ncbi:MAG: trimethylamine methyltransferase family protein, partial [Deltaproteobacteria bacterium]|nr:trimethylamine methyltransferase family protein [Deltaproteobacteria bacterium]
MNMLSDRFMEQIISEAMDVLAKTGVMIENDEAMDLLQEAGCACHENRVNIKESLIQSALKSVPDSITLYDRSGNPAMNLLGDCIHFDPGSAALTILDSGTLKQREPMTCDLVNFAILTDALPNIAAQSTGLISADVPKI